VTEGRVSPRVGGCNTPTSAQGTAPHGSAPHWPIAATPQRGPAPKVPGLRRLAVTQFPSNSLRPIPVRTGPPCVHIGSGPKIVGVLGRRKGGQATVFLFGGGRKEGGGRHDRRIFSGSEVPMHIVVRAARPLASGVTGLWFGGDAERSLLETSMRSYARHTEQMLAVQGTDINGSDDLCFDSSTGTVIDYTEAGRCQIRQRPGVRSASARR
jgi:hypothetical protein